MSDTKQLTVEEKLDLLLTKVDGLQEVIDRQSDEIAELRAVVSDLDITSYGSGYSIEDASWN